LTKTRRTALGFLLGLLGLAGCASFNRSPLGEAELAFRQGRYAEADSRGRAALAAAEGANDPSAAGEAAGFLAGLQVLQGRSAQAEGLYRKALSNFEREGDRRAAAATAYDLGSVLSLQGKTADAETHYRRAVELSQRPGAPAEELLEHLSGLAVFLESQRRFDDAEPVYLKAVGAARRLGGKRAEQAQKDYDDLLARKRREAAK
jgi:tetratricopeptide (TPR) repeat protein